MPMLDRTGRSMRQALENPFYYLDNFRQVLAWVGERHGDLLHDHERAFLDHFHQVPQAAQAFVSAIPGIGEARAKDVVAYEFMADFRVHARLRGQRG